MPRPAMGYDNPSRLLERISMLVLLGPRMADGNCGTVPERARERTRIGARELSRFLAEPAVAPDRGGITFFRDSTSHQPPRQVNGVVRPLEGGRDRGRVARL